MHGDVIQTKAEGKHEQFVSHTGTLDAKVYKMSYTRLVKSSVSPYR